MEPIAGFPRARNRKFHGMARVMSEQGHLSSMLPVLPLHLFPLALSHVHTNDSLLWLRQDTSFALTLSSLGY